MFVFLKTNSCYVWNLNALLNFYKSCFQIKLILNYTCNLIVSLPSFPFHVVHHSTHIQIRPTGYVGVMLHTCSMLHTAVAILNVGVLMFKSMMRILWPRGGGALPLWRWRGCKAPKTTYFQRCCHPMTPYFCWLFLLSPKDPTFFGEMWAL